MFPQTKKKFSQLNKLHLTENVREKGIHYFTENINTQARAHAHTHTHTHTHTHMHTTLHEHIWHLMHTCYTTTNTFTFS